MLKKSQGIVLSYIRYQETSIIVRIFTRELGLKSYIVNGVRVAKGKNKMALYQPLTILDLVVYDKESLSLNRISEAKLQYPYQQIPFDYIRSGIAMFVAEAISKSIYEGYQNEQLYDFLEQSLKHLDGESVKLALFPIVFLLEMSNYLGFAPSDSKSFFEEILQEMKVPELIQQELQALDHLIAESFDCKVTITSKTRKALLDHLLIFYSQHLEDHGAWKSVKVLRQLLL
ncbi:DNA replication and repair protein RecO [Belliella buryatensis]|uniref:DNA repair protein RecO n=1 Tax=Belliella buryatensis TaxID=1500549 RepID=A0A239E6Z6_9BACT|nr:DNA repair protein RecO [Belliella buryatensis]SNS39702.1 DNA replication and repair protein RecO [Belliella buryatensis]